MTEMIRHPRVMEKAQDEVREAFNGRRMCPGINFGLVSVKLFLAQMLYNFDWKLPDGLSPMELDMTEVKSSIVAKKFHLQLIPTSYAP
nr:premnaspirodiene oxygenase-like [Tanacetum cinerariifolium]